MARLIPLQQIQIDDTFWSKYLTLVRETVIPYQWNALNDAIPDAAPSFAIRNFKIAAGLEQGEFGGMVFQDSDVAKWLEAVAYALATAPDDDLKRLADETIEIIVQAQMEDGYLNTYFTIQDPAGRWTNLNECHELYCAGHMMEAAVAYFEATGERKLLDAMCRFADHIDNTFGVESGKLRGYPGHQEIELALVKLYNVTQEPRYLALAQYFIDERGQSPSYFVQEWETRGRTWHWPHGPQAQINLSYNQSHLPVREQSVAVGHSVRAVYMYTAMADLARLTADDGLTQACQRLWDNVTSKQMYVTGGIGSTHHGEAFTFDYDLPNDTVYAETCASVGLIFFAARMLQLDANAKYADVLEKALYNIILASMSLDGRHYFYVNPLEVWPDAADKNPGKQHVKAERQKWFGCACCPPNVARLLSSLGQYIYSVSDDTLYTHLFIGNQAEVEIGQTRVRIHQQSNLPWDGHVSLSINPADPAEFGLAIRLPGWCSEPVSVRINGDVVDLDTITQAGYAVIRRIWSSGDVVEIHLPMGIQLLAAHPQVRSDSGKIALTRGPLVYCLEEVDNAAPLSAIQVSIDSTWTTHFDPDLHGGIIRVQGSGWRDDERDWGTSLYRPVSRALTPVAIAAVPYYAWGNRGVGEMAVWLRGR